MSIKLYAELKGILSRKMLDSGRTLEFLHRLDFQLPDSFSRQLQKGIFTINTAMHVQYAMSNTTYVIW